MAKNKKQDEAKKDDLLKRNAEMAESQNPETAAKILKKGDKYYCAECHSEIPMHKDCPTCHAHVEWDRVMMERR
jgi:rubrerythrin